MNYRLLRWGAIAGSPCVVAFAPGVAVAGSPPSPAPTVSSANTPLKKLGLPTNPRVARIVEKIKKRQSDGSWYITADDFVAALGQAGMIGGITDTAEDSGAPVAVAASLTREATVRRDGARLWQNLNQHGPNGLIAALPLGTRVGWRYNYNSSYAVVLWYQTSTWGFILRDALSCCKNDGSPN